MSRRRRRNLGPSSPPLTNSATSFTPVVFKCFLFRMRFAQSLSSTDASSLVSTCVFCRLLEEDELSSRREDATAAARNSANLDQDVRQKPRDHHHRPICSSLIPKSLSKVWQFVLMKSDRVSHFIHFVPVWLRRRWGKEFGCQI